MLSKGAVLTCAVGAPTDNTSLESSAITHGHSQDKNFQNNHSKDVVCYKEASIHPALE